MTGTAATLWFETMAMTALLIAAVLLVRKPVAALFGPRIAYALWLIPLLRLVLPPLPGGVTIVTAGPTAAVLPIEAGAAIPRVAVEAAAFDPAALLAVVPTIWLAGFIAVLGWTLLRHRHWLRQTLAEATPLDPVGRVRLVMSAGVGGPVATGLLRPLIAVPMDFFARYNRAERALAIKHELAHHRAGDLWANAAALIVVAAQWFNPLAWVALAAFRFDQEAACDARILGAVAAPERKMQAHHYARAIAKSLAGPRLLLAAPMTSGKAVKERLHMLSKDPQQGLRTLFGRILLGGTACAALALTISTLPNQIVYAAQPDAPPPVAEAPQPGEPVVKEDRVHQVMIIHADDADSAAVAAADGDGKHHTVRQVIMHSDGGDDANGKPRMMMFEGGHDPNVDAKLAPMVRLAMPFGRSSNDDLRATLKEQGIDDAKADAIIKQLEEKRAKAVHQSFNWSGRGEAMTMARCKDGAAPQVMVNTHEGPTKVRIVQCGAQLAPAKQIEAMKKARDRMAAQKDGHGMSAEIRASVVADLDKAIAELEAQKDN